MWNQKIKDFGDVKGGDVLEFTFVYSGEGKIIGVASSCGCTTTTTDHKEIKATYTVVNKGKNYVSAKHLTVTIKKDTGIVKDKLQIKANVKK